MNQKLDIVFEAEGNKVLFQGARFLIADSPERAKELAPLFQLAYNVGRTEEANDINKRAQKLMDKLGI